MPAVHNPGMVGILPLLFALVVAASSRAAEPVAFSVIGLPTWASSLLVVAASLVAWCAINALIGWWARRRDLTDERAAGWWDRLGTVLALIIYVLWCRYARWADLSAWSVVQILPMAALLLPVWRSAALLALGDRPQSAEAALVNRVRFGILPGLLAILLFDLVQILAIDPLMAPLDEAGDAWWAPLAILGVILIGPMLVLGALPPLLVRLWRAKPMPPGPHRELLEEGCRAAGVRADRIWHWPAAGGRFYNAAVLGLFPRWRYVLFSDDLLKDLPPRQLLAVLGHELGHIKHRHLPLMLMYLLMATVIASLVAQPLLAGVIGGFGLDGELAEIGIMIALFLLVLWFGFGFLSRACERQADLAGARLVGDPRTMSDALHSVALLSGHHPQAPSWRHGSIASRMAYLAEVERDPRQAGEHHRRVRRLTWLILIGLLLLPISAYFFMQQPAADDEWFAEHPQAAAAWDAAADGDIEALREWLRDSEPATRAPLGWHLIFAAQELAQDPETTDRDLVRWSYHHRHRLTLLGLAGIGKPEADLFLVNAGAYTAVSTTRDLTALDRELSWEALPRLHRAAYEYGDHAVHDTVGCIYHVHGKHELAAEHFELALGLLASDPPADEARRAEMEALYRSRLEAARAGDPLPLDPHAPDDLEPADGAAAAAEPSLVP